MKHEMNHAPSPTPKTPFFTGPKSKELAVKLGIKAHDQTGNNYPEEYSDVLAFNVNHVDENILEAAIEALKQSETALDFITECVINKNAPPSSGAPKP